MAKNTYKTAYVNEPNMSVMIYGCGIFKRKAKVNVCCFDYVCTKGFITSRYLHTTFKNFFLSFFQIYDFPNLYLFPQHIVLRLFNHDKPIQVIRFPNKSFITNSNLSSRFDVMKE